jgi:hypothetical protein
MNDSNIIATRNNLSLWIGELAKHWNLIERASNNNFIFIDIDSKNRFAMRLKDSFIFESKKYIPNKKKFICLLCEWNEFDWSTFYPYRKSLYDWQKTKETRLKKRAAKRTGKSQKRIMAETMPDWSRAFTGRTSKPDERPPEHGEGLGNQGAPDQRNHQGKSKGGNPATPKEKRKRSV